MKSLSFIKIKQLYFKIFRNEFLFYYLEIIYSFGRQRIGGETKRKRER